MGLTRKGKVTLRVKLGVMKGRKKWNCYVVEDSSF